MSRNTFQLLIERMSTYDVRSEQAAYPPDATAEAARQIVATLRSSVDDLLSEATARAKVPPPPDQLLDVRGVAAYLDVSERFVESLIAEGKLTPIRLSSKIRRFTTDAVDAYLRSCTSSRRTRR